jgi:hypothetical protein
VLFLDKGDRRPVQPNVLSVLNKYMDYRKVDAGIAHDHSSTLFVWALDLQKLNAEFESKDSIACSSTVRREEWTEKLGHVWSDAPTKIGHFKNAFGTGSTIVSAEALVGRLSGGALFACAPAKHIAAIFAQRLRGDAYASSTSHHFALLEYNTYLMPLAMLTGIAFLLLAFVVSE